MEGEGRNRSAVRGPAFEGPAFEGPAMTVFVRYRIKGPGDAPEKQFAHTGSREETTQQHTAI